MYWKCSFIFQTFQLQETKAMNNKNYSTLGSTSVASIYNAYIQHIYSQSSVIKETQHTTQHYSVFSKLQRSSLHSISNAALYLQQALFLQVHHAGGMQSPPRFSTQFFYSSAVLARSSRWRLWKGAVKNVFTLQRMSSHRTSSRLHAEENVCDTHQVFNYIV